MATTVNLTGTAINLYIIATLTYFCYLCHTAYTRSENYFAAFLVILQDPLSKLLLYNFVVATATLFYRINIWLFYEEVKENETLVIP